MITIEALGSEKIGLQKLQHNPFCANIIVEGKECSGFEMSVESTESHDHFGFGFSGFFRWLLSPLKIMSNYSTN